MVDIGSEQADVERPRSVGQSKQIKVQTAPAGVCQRVDKDLFRLASPGGQQKCCRPRNQQAPRPQKSGDRSKRKMAAFLRLHGGEEGDLAGLGTLDQQSAME
ncbi:hypothetical protein UK82_24335 [Frankia sp. ACN1ag]|nr:hypothetical protein UK82_24335 [Frankia sp. ACN1ag]